MAVFVVPTNRLLTFYNSRMRKAIENLKKDAPKAVTDEVEAVEPVDHRGLMTGVDVEVAVCSAATDGAQTVRQEQSLKEGMELAQKAFPDVHVEVWKPWRGRKSGYFTVMLAACTDKESAQAAANLAKRRGFAPDAFVWYDVPPWEPVE